MSALSPFDALVGTWTTEATHPSLPGVVVHGTTTWSWLEGEAFLIQRSHNDHEQFPDAIAVIGPREGNDDTATDLAMEYFDSRGVRRTYMVSLTDGTLRIWRDAEGFDQRFSARVGGDGFSGVWELAEEAGAWVDDVAISYRRVLETP